MKQEALKGLLRPDGLHPGREFPPSMLAREQYLDPLRTYVVQVCLCDVHYIVCHRVFLKKERVLAWPFHKHVTCVLAGHPDRQMRAPNDRESDLLTT